MKEGRRWLSRGWAAGGTERGRAARQQRGTRHFGRSREHRDHGSAPLDARHVSRQGGWRGARRADAIGRADDRRMVRCARAAEPEGGAHGTELEPRRREQRQYQAQPAPRPR